MKNEIEFPLYYEEHRSPKLMRSYLKARAHQLIKNRKKHYGKEIKAKIRHFLEEASR